MIKLAPDQRARAEAILDTMVNSPDTMEDYAYEIIYLRDGIAKIREAVENIDGRR